MTSCPGNRHLCQCLLTRICSGRTYQPVDLSRKSSTIQGNGYFSLDQGFPNFHAHMNHQQILLKILLLLFQYVWIGAWGSPFLTNSLFHRPHFEQTTGVGQLFTSFCVYGYYFKACQGPQQSSSPPNFPQSV